MSAYGAFVWKVSSTSQVFLKNSDTPPVDIFPCTSPSAFLKSLILSVPPELKEPLPWAECATDAERLDVFNGLLLAPNLDAAFDRGFITVAENGEVLVSERLSDADRRALGLDVRLRVSSLDDSHQTYLRFHRERVFKDSTSQVEGWISGVV